MTGPDLRTCARVHDDDPHVLSAEGEETVCPRAAAAQQAATLKYWIDDGSADDGCAFDTRTPEVAGSGVPAQTLRALAAFSVQCDAAASAWAAEDRSLAELAQIPYGLTIAHIRQTANSSRG